MDLYKKYLLNSIACFAPRGRVADAIVDDSEPYEPDATGDDAADVEAEAGPEGEDGTAGDETGDEDPGEDEPEEYEVEPRRPVRGRAQARIERLSNDNATLKAEIAASAARLAAVEARLNQPATREAQADEEARLALMSPQERSEYRVERALANNQRQTADVLQSIQDQTDASAFRVLLGEKPQYKKFEKLVETRVKELRGKKTPLPREAVLMFLVGEAAVKATEKPRTKAQSQQRMQQQETRPASGRGDVRADRRQAGSQVSAVERRLANIRI